MTQITQIIVDYDSNLTKGGMSAFYFDNSVDSVANQRLALQNMFLAIRSRFATVMRYDIRQQGIVLEADSGGLVAEWSATVAYGGPGTGATEPVPNASQVLLRWGTPTVVSGRLLKGRNYVPGLAVSGTDDGQLTQATMDAINDAQDDFIADAVGFGVWHRPTGGSGGLFVEATSGSVWNELAVLRNRR